MSSYRTEPDHSHVGWPKGLPYIIGNEGCERFSFYGMKAILYLYIVGLYIQLHGMGAEAAQFKATSASHLFIAGVYFVPLVGGIIADRLLGKYWTIMSLSVVYCLGHLALAIFENPSMQRDFFGTVYIDPMMGLGIGLFLICLGSGGIKPCVSAHVGDQFGRGNWFRLETVFNAFYFIINFGSAFATIIIPVIRGKIIEGQDGTFMGYEGSIGWAFGLPGILMGLATIAFWMGRKVFIHIPPKPGGVLGILDTAAAIALFGVIAYPIFFHSVVGTTLLGTSGISVMCLGTFIILFGIRQHLEQDDGFLAIVFYTIFFDRSQNTSVPVDAPTSLKHHKFWGPAARKFGIERTQGPIAVFRVISVFLMVSVFWALFDQHASTWIQQAMAMNTVFAMDVLGWVALIGAVGLAIGIAIGLSIRKQGDGWNKLYGSSATGMFIGCVLGWVLHINGGHYEVLPSQIPSINPFLVMILIPYTAFGLYPLMRHMGWNPHPLRRMTLGMFMASVSFVAVALIQMAIDAGAADGTQIHVGWQIIPYAIITLSEVMVSITGLEFAYSQAPKRMKSIIMGFWLFNVTLGSLIVVLFAGFEGMTPVKFFWFFAAMMALAAVLFGLRAKYFRYCDYTQ